MKIGFSYKIITPPAGMELGGYAKQRKCDAVHDELFCKCVVLQQQGVKFVLLALDLLCVDVSLYDGICNELEKRGVKHQNIIISAIHSHSAPRGIVPEKGELKDINRQNIPDDDIYEPYILNIIKNTVEAYDIAVSSLEKFKIRTAQDDSFNIGSERHNGKNAKGTFTVIDFLTESGKRLVVYNFPCHPTVMNADNLSVSADFVADIQGLLRVDMSVFINGAAGDISTRFTRRESSFEECNRLAKLIKDKINQLISGEKYELPTQLKGKQEIITLCARKVESETDAKKRLEKLNDDLKTAVQAKKDEKTLRILRSYVEGAGTNLKFAQSMKNIKLLHLSVTAFIFAGIKFISLPAELFSSLTPNDENIVFLCYSNGYYRYICDEDAYSKNYYEALGSIIEKGEGEKFINKAINVLKKVLNE